MYDYESLERTQLISLLRKKDTQLKTLRNNADAKICKSFDGPTHLDDATKRIQLRDKLNHERFVAKQAYLHDKGIQCTIRLPSDAPKMTPERIENLINIDREKMAALEKLRHPEEHINQRPKPIRNTQLDEELVELLGDKSFHDVSDDMTFKELKIYCKKNNLKGFSKFTRKNDLLRFIREQ